MATIKLKFNRDYTPRKKGEVVELETKLANFYLAVGVAEICDCENKNASEKCDDCESASDLEKASALPEEKKVKEPKKSKKK